MRKARMFALLVALCLSVASIASASSFGSALSKGGQAGASKGLGSGKLAPSTCLYCGNAFYYGTVNGWNISGGWAVSDSFTLTAPGTPTSSNIITWQSPGDFMTGVDWAIGTSPFSNNVSSGTSASFDTYLFTNSYGYDIYNDGFGLVSPTLGAGTYWLTLQNATSAFGGYSYWDQNYGPSAAYQSGFGFTYSRPSEAFRIDGVSGATPEPSSLLLFGSGLLGLGGMIRRRLGR